MITQEHELQHGESRRSFPLFLSQRPWMALVHDIDLAYIADWTESSLTVSYHFCVVFAAVVVGFAPLLAWSMRNKTMYQRTKRCIIAVRDVNRSLFGTISQKAVKVQVSAKVLWLSVIKHVFLPNNFELWAHFSYHISSWNLLCGIYRE